MRVVPYSASLTASVLLFLFTAILIILGELPLQPWIWLVLCGLALIMFFLVAVPINAEPPTGGRSGGQP